MKKMKAMMMATAMMAVSLSMTAQNQKSVNLTIGVPTDSRPDPLV